MSERIYKLQPNRTMQLRGFDHLGASAALHSATADSFKLSGVFRDPSDFAVLILYDADNFYEHPRIKYLPDFDFDGLTLTFDVHYDAGLMPLDSPKYPTIDWPYLDVIREDGSVKKIALFDYAAQVSGDWTAAEASFTILADDFKRWDRLTLWYLNIPFDFVVPQVECSFAFTAQGPGTLHWVELNGIRYSYVEQDGDGNLTVCARLLQELAGNALVNAFQGAYNQIDLRATPGDGRPFPVRSSSNPLGHILYSVSAQSIARSLADRINTINWNERKILFPIEATQSGTTIHLRSQRRGRDGNFLTMYAVNSSDRLKTEEPVAKFTGGVSDATWRVSINFTALRVPRIRQMWLTFAPNLPNGASFDDKQPAEFEYEATFTNWHLSGPEEKRTLQVAGPASIRIEENDAWCKYQGAWVTEAGFYSRGMARVATTIGDSVTIHYYCPVEHELWVGTSLYQDRGVAGVSVDGGVETSLDCSLKPLPPYPPPPDPEAPDPLAPDPLAPINTRRKVRDAVPPGHHSVKLRLTGGPRFYFDFLEAVVRSDVPASLPPQFNASPALDYSTDHTYKLPPARIHWNFDQLGFAGPMNEYIGVFWWNNRKRSNAWIPYVEVRFTGAFQPGDQVFLEIGGLRIGKSVFPNEDGELIARHLQYLINATFVGVWARCEGDRLYIHNHSAAAAYAFTFSAWYEAGGVASAQVTARSFDENGNVIAPTLSNGREGTWVVDPIADSVLNRGARDWHADMFGQCAARVRLIDGVPTPREITVAASMELVNPPEDFVARFADGSAVETAIGFGDLHSTHCNFGFAMRSYQKRLYREIAQLMAEAGLTPNLQFGEFLWWFFPQRSLTPLAVAHGTPIEIYFHAPHGLHDGEEIWCEGFEGCTAANGTWPVTVVNSHQVALVGSAGNAPWVQGTGAGRTGSMAYYDADTMAAAQSVLGRPLRTFLSPDEDPAVNAFEDATFLRNRLRDHVAELAAHIRGTFPNAKLEILFPYDVNHPQPAGIHRLGGRLNRYINLPVEWESKQTSGLDRLKLENLDFGAWCRDLNLVETSLHFALKLNWPRNSVRYLVPIFTRTSPWEKEARLALNFGFPIINYWAFDHVCIYGWPIQPRPLRPSSEFVLL